MDSNQKTFDFSHLDSITHGDENFKKELVGIFLEQIPGFIENMKNYLELNKLENLAREAHTAKSSVLIFGMENTGALLKDIQHLAEIRQTAGIGQILLQVEKELNQANFELTDWVNHS